MIYIPAFSHYQLVFDNSIAVSIVGEDAEEKVQYYKNFNNLSPDREPLPLIIARLTNWFLNTGNCKIYVYPYMKEKKLQRLCTLFKLWMGKKNNLLPGDVILQDPKLPISKIHLAQFEEMNYSETI